MSAARERTAAGAANPRFGEVMLALPYPALPANRDRHRVAVEAFHRVRPMVWIDTMTIGAAGASTKSNVFMGR
jgi:hypothetical protein